MSFALQENEPLPAAIRRLAVEQIDLALGHLQTADINQSIHDTRQRLKRIRALLLLVRGELGDKVFEREWACYRNLGRLLAGGRDAAVVVETLDALVDHFSPELAADAFASERRYLVDRRDARLRVIEQQAVLKQAAEILRAARERAATWPLDGTDFKAIREGVRRSYRAGRRGLQTVIQHPSSTNFHEWRKPVKILWCQLQILTPIWPVMVNAHTDELHALSDRLNSNHDLDVLLQTALWSGADPHPCERQALASFVNRRCRQLETEGLELGERLYCERPRYFAARLQRYWQTWEHGSARLRGSSREEGLKKHKAAGFAARVDR